MGSKRSRCDSSSYLYNAAGGYAQKYVLINSGSLGLLLNREEKNKVVIRPKPHQKGEGIIFVQGVGYDVTYKVKINGTQRAVLHNACAS